MSKKVRIAYLLFLVIIGGSIIHNLVYAAFKFEEPIFFLVSALSIPALLIYLFVNSLIFIKSKKPKDWWKVIWIILLIIVFVMWMYLKRIKYQKQKEAAPRPSNPITKIT